MPGALPFRQVVLSVPLLFLLLIGVGSAVGPSVAETSADAAREQQRLQGLRARIASLTSEIRSKEGEKSEVSRQLRDAERKIGERSRQLRDLDERLRLGDQRLKGLQAQRAEQQTELAAQRQALAQQIRTAYALGRQERVKLLLNQQDPSTVSRIMVYHDYLSRARIRKMASLREQMAGLAETERTIRLEEAALADLREEQTRGIEVLEQRQAERRSAIARLDEELGDSDARLTRLLHDERALTSLVRGLEAAMADVPITDSLAVGFEKRRGKLRWPAAGDLIKRFGSPRLGGLVWDGVMIATPGGREVRAVHHGRVAFADWLRGLGLLLIVDHGDGFMSLYGHNQSLFKEVGDWVEADEPVARAGNSGGLDRSGVYFGIRRQGRAVDPLLWCIRPKGRRVG